MRPPTPPFLNVNQGVLTRARVRGPQENCSWGSEGEGSAACCEVGYGDLSSRVHHLPLLHTGRGAGEVEREQCTG